MQELSLLATKQSILATVSEGTQDEAIKRQLQPFSDQDLAVLYDRSLDLDAQLLVMAFE